MVDRGDMERHARTARAIFAAVALGLASASPMPSSAEPAFDAPFYLYDLGEHGPISLAVGDLNEDGAPDVAVHVGQSIRTFLGNGDGTLRPAVTLTPHVGSIALGDLNGDGHLDLVQSAYYDSTIAVFPGSGNGSFGSPSSFMRPPRSSYPEIGDIDGDGWNDIVLAPERDAYGPVTVFRGSGNFTFAAPLTFGEYFQSAYIALQDMNSDGDFEIAMVAGIPSVSLNLLDWSDGQLSNAWGREMNLVSRRAVDLVPKDLDHDGDFDLISLVCQYPANWELVVMKNEAGAFSVTEQLNAGYWTMPFWMVDRGHVAAGDFNGDGWPDVALGIRFSGLLFYGSPTGLSAVGNWEFMTGLSPREVLVAAADLDGDGTDDLIAVDQDGLLTTRLGGPAGFGRGVRSLAIRPTPLMIGADLDHDGRSDVALCSTPTEMPDSLVFYRSLGQGNFEPEPVWASSAHRPIELLTDGSDLVLVSASCGGCLPAGNILPFVGNGSGSFEAATPTPLTEPPVDAALCHWNSDALYDLLVVDYANTGQLWIAVQGDGHSFTTGDNLPLGLVPLAVATGKLDVDSKPDAVIAGATSLTVVTRNTANDLIVHPHDMNTAGFSDIRCADLDRDGIDEVLVRMGARVTVLRSNGSGELNEVQSVNLAPMVADDPAKRLDVADFDGDGCPDLLGAGFMASSIAYGRCDGTFGDRAYYGTPFAWGAVSGDVDGDERVDIVYSSFQSTGHVYGPSELTTLRNRTGAVTPVQLTFQSADVQGLTVHLRWSAPGASTPAVVERRSGSASWLTCGAAVTERDAYSYVDRVPAPGRYQYRLRFSGNLTPTEATSVEVAAPIRLAVTPNPSSGSFQISWSADFAGRAALSLFDLQGRRMLHREVDSAERHEWIRTHLPAGVYLLRVALGAHTVQKRVLVTR